MSKPKFTPGPWEDCGEGRIYTECKPGKMSWKVCQLATTGREGLKDMKANARLIAQAPTLYKFLKILAERMDADPNPEYQTILDGALAVLAAIDGKE